ncbi:multiple epidermal growth factor-like domains protein 10 [Saccostrea cucullata]|uniref:multiple epidermal growth factor-like domains protein 10 n=1 Tax=Saccostrea cuccullata TaxID=36930 RepID=UPI002ED1BE0C
MTRANSNLAFMHLSSEVHRTYKNGKEQTHTSITPDAESGADDEFSWGADKTLDGLFTNRSAGGGQCTISDKCEWLYSLHCNQSCGWCLNFGQCHHIDGTCLKGCEIGFKVDKCTEECPVKRYGYNCQDTCSINCRVPGRCNRATGECHGGCQSGWKGIRCDKRCVLEMSGYNCNKTCNTDCFNGTCDITADACLLVGAPDPHGINIAYIIGGASAAIFVTVTVVIFVIVSKRSRVRKGHNGHQNISTQVFIDNVTATIEIYNKIEDNGGYYELGELESETVICNKCEKKGRIPGNWWNKSSFSYCSETLK